MGYAVVSGYEAPYGVYLILHEGDQRGYDYRRALHHESRQLIAHGLSSSRRHEHECVVAVHEMLDYTFLISLERVKSEKLLQFGMQCCRIW